MSPGSLPKNGILKREKITKLKPRITKIEPAAIRNLPKLLISSVVFTGFKHPQAGVNYIISLKNRE
jgi:hypothetical protein